MKRLPRLQKDKVLGGERGGGKRENVLPLEPLRRPNVPLGVYGRRSALTPQLELCAPPQFSLGLGHSSLPRSLVHKQGVPINELQVGVPAQERRGWDWGLSHRFFPGSGDPSPNVAVKSHVGSRAKEWRQPPHIQPRVVPPDMPAGTLLHWAAQFLAHLDFGICMWWLFSHKSMIGPWRKTWP